ncbi:MAG: type II secretion system protein GspG [Nitrospirota bacterium]
MITYLDALTREARETALKMSLGNIRMSIQLYHALNERYPRDIRELLTTGYLLPAGKDSVFVPQYLEAQALDHDGYPVDPFGHRYRYQPTEGRVLSESKGYEQW